jgi:PIN domain nuclease of toxin-antitoxin system
VTLVLDTHVFYWWLVDDQRLSRAQRRALSKVSEASPAHVCDITLWELSTLVSLNRLKLGLPLREWLERAVAPPFVEVEAITPAVAAEVAALGSSLHRDPGDRLVVATARVLGAHLLTRDEAIIESGLVPTIS